MAAKKKSTTSGVVAVVKDAAQHSVEAVKHGFEAAGDAIKHVLGKHEPKSAATKRGTGTKQKSASKPAAKSAGGKAGKATQRKEAGKSSGGMKMTKAKPISKRVGSASGMRRGRG